MRVRRYISKWRFTVGAFLGGVVVIGLLVFALYDWVTSVKVSDQQARVNTLTAELSNFLLSTREPDGFSLLENPRDFAAAERPLRFVELRKPFFSYLLNRQNARRLTAEKITWDAPRPCVVEFSKKQDSAIVPVQACFATVPSDPVGRFGYFSIRYPTEGIRRHRNGTNVAGEDRVVIRFSSSKVPPIVLLFKPPTLAVSRYPSQLERFSGIHEIAAFLAGNPERPLRQINAQAYEQVGEGEDARNFVTIVGRVDASFLDPQAESSEAWPSATIASLSIGLDIHGHDSEGKDTTVVFEPGALGRAQVSLQSAFLASVPSRSVLRVVQTDKSGERTVWTSTSLNLPSQPRRTDWQQRVSDWWAQLLLARSKAEPDKYETHFQLPAPVGYVEASLVAPPVALPAAATRAFGWLTAALLIVFLLVSLFVFAIVRLRLFTSLAWTLASNKMSLGDVRIKEKRRDEVSTLWRVLTVLYRKNQANIRARVNLIHKATANRAKEVRMMQARLELRQERLLAIGHEINSPLASLLVRTKGDEEIQHHLRRMHNAIEVMLDAATVEDGIQNQQIICASLDLADYLWRSADNSKDTIENLLYEGPKSGVICSVDELYFETVLHHLLTNAVRHRRLGSTIRIRLRVDEENLDAVVEVCNDGEEIPLEKLKAIFQYRTSDRLEPRNRGLGLYAARSYLVAMKATIFAENRDGGVAFVVLVPLA